MALCGPVVLIAWNNLRDAVASRPLVDLARRIEYRRTVAPAAIAAALPTVDRTARTDRCVDAANRAAVTIALVAQQGENPALDFAGWSAALERSSAILRKGLTCTPLNANFWARLALNERAAAPASQRMAAMARVSARLGPAEAGGLMTRAEIWRTSPWLEDDDARTRDRDIRTILAQARVPDAVRMFRGAPHEIETAARKVVADLPTPRRQALTQGGLFAAAPSLARPAPDGYFGGLFPDRSALDGE